MTMRPADVLALVRDELAQQAQSAYDECARIDQLLSPPRDSWTDLGRPDGDRQGESRRLLNIFHSEGLKIAKWP